MEESWQDNNRERERAAAYRMREADRKRSDEHPDEQIAFRKKKEEEEANQYKELTDS
jgi:hypothetical protein